MKRQKHLEDWCVGTSVLSPKYLTILPPIHPVSRRCLRSPNLRRSPALWRLARRATRRPNLGNLFLGQNTSRLMGEMVTNSRIQDFLYWHKFSYICGHRATPGHVLRRLTPIPLWPRSPTRDASSDVSTFLRGSAAFGLLLPHPAWPGAGLPTSPRIGVGGRRTPLP